MTWNGFGATVEQMIKQQKLDSLKREVQKKAQMANKRLERLERNNLTDLPAYQQWVSYDGGVRFGVRGKDYNQLQSELGRVNRFIDSKTSLVRQANAHLKEVANTVGIGYGSVKELPIKLKSFFELSSKIEQYLRNVEGSASAIGYHKIWEVVNEYVESEGLDLGEANLDVEDALDKLLELITYEELTERDMFFSSDWTKIDW